MNGRVLLNALTKRYGDVTAVHGIEGVSAAVKLAEGLAAIGLKTSKVGGYAAALQVGVQKSARARA